MVSAHRGASFEFPENTLLSMEKAVEAGADMIEFDLRGTSENIPVLLHDETIDRTSDGKGMPEEYTLEELRKFNFSCYLQGMRRTAPICEKMPIPTFEEVLEKFRGKVAMNIQVYAKSKAVLENICRLFKEYDMYDHGYFTIKEKYIEEVRSLDKNIEFCTTRGWETRSDPANIRLCKEADHCRFLQPVREFSTKETFSLIRDLDMKSNVYFTDTPEEMLALKEMGATGVLTNKAHLLCQTRNEMEK